MSWDHNNNTQNEMELELRSMPHLYVIMMSTEHNHLIGEFDRRLIFVELVPTLLVAHFREKSEVLDQLPILMTPGNEALPKILGRICFEEGPLEILN